MVDLLEFGGPPFLALLPDELAARLIEAGVSVFFDDGESIHLRGDIRPGLSIVKSGAVRFSVPGIDGSNITTSILGVGHCFGEATLYAHLPRTHDAEAVGRTNIIQITEKRIDRLFDEEPKLARYMLEATTHRLYSLVEFTDDLRRLPIDVRIAKILYSMVVQAKLENTIDANQSDIAFTLGVSRVSAGKSLNRLQSFGLIELGYGKIRVIDKEALFDWIDEHSVTAPLIRSMEN